ncbi:hypothetical protein PTKIN_Ptkin08bG0159500 [Pterospermum kingtungense]
MFMKSYQYPLQPINGAHEWKKCGLEPLLPPITWKTPGRLKKNKRKSKDEPKKKRNIKGIQKDVAEMARTSKARTSKVGSSKTTSSKATSMVEGTKGVQPDGKHKQTGGKKQSKGKEKISDSDKRRPIRGRKPTIKGIGFYTNLKTGQETLYFGTKGIVIREPTSNITSGLRGKKRKTDDERDGTNARHMKKKKMIKATGNFFAILQPYGFVLKT